MTSQDIALPDNLNDMSHYNIAQHLLDVASPAAKIVDEEVSKGIENAKRRLQELPEYSGVTDLSHEVRKLMEYRFGHPVAKNLTTIHRQSNGWNAFLRSNYKRKCEEVELDNGVQNGTLCSFSPSNLSTSETRPCGQRALGRVAFGGQGYIHARGGI